MRQKTARQKPGAKARATNGATHTIQRATETIKCATKIGRSRWKIIGEFNWQAQAIANSASRVAPLIRVARTRFLEGVGTAVQPLDAPFSFL